MFKLLEEYPNLKISQIYMFVLVADNNNFLETAKLLGISQPAVSSAIRQLEKTMNVKLFDRTTKKIELTNLGKEVLPYAKKLIEIYGQTASFIDADTKIFRGTVSLVLLPSITSACLSRVLPDFVKKFPNVKIQISDANASRLTELILEGKADFAIGNLYGFFDEINFYPLLEDRIGLVCKKNNPLAQKKNLSWEEVLNRPDFIGNGIGILMKEHGLDPDKSGIYVRNVITLIALIKHDIGITLLPETICENLSSDLVFLPIDRPVIYRKIGIFHHKNRIISHPTREFMRMIQEIFQKRET